MVGGRQGPEFWKARNLGGKCGEVGELLGPLHAVDCRPGPELNTEFLLLPSSRRCAKYSLTNKCLSFRKVTFGPDRLDPPRGLAEKLSRHLPEFSPFSFAPHCLRAWRAFVLLYAFGLDMPKAQSLNAASSIEDPATKTKIDLHAWGMRGVRIAYNNKNVCETLSVT